MNKTDMGFMPATEMIAAIKKKTLSPREIVEALLARVEKINPKVNAYCTVVPEMALEAAKKAEAEIRQGGKLGPLHGIPVSIKDLTLTAGIRTTFGSKIFEHHVPTEDALIVQRLKAAGAIVIGKTNTPEFGAGANTYNAVFGATRNPWKLSHTCGGSSGGAAVALACGLGPLATGSDLGGSLRIPASFCGVVGFRTSAGRVPIYPSFMGWDTLAVEGPMARTVGDTALMLSVIAGADDRSPISLPGDGREFLAAVEHPNIRGFKVAWSADLKVSPVDREIEAVAGAAAKRFTELGCTVEQAEPDFSRVREIIHVTRALRMVTLHAEKLEKWRDQMNPNLVWNIEKGFPLTAQQVGMAEKERTALYHRVRQFFERYDLLLTPTVAVPPFPVEMPYPQEINGKPINNYQEWLYLTYAITVTGLPAISVPCGWTAEGLPVGLQIVGRRLGEATVLRAAAAFEAIAPWQDKRPPVE
ncbi:MAG: amidase [Deltaproteobacteria bacterium]|nr:amidase [Deltaproteobacteria bacterium]